MLYRLRPRIEGGSLTTLLFVFLPAALNAHGNAQGNAAETFHAETTDSTPYRLQAYPASGSLLDKEGTPAMRTQLIYFWLSIEEIPRTADGSPLVRCDARGSC